MKHFLAISLCVLIICTGCEKEHKGIIINTEDSLLFNGIFVTSAYYGPATLRIDRGNYEFYNSLPNGIGAGSILATDDVLEFRDTLDLPILHAYGYAFVPRGYYYYRFDGNKLELQKYINGGKIMFVLYLDKSL